MSRGKTLDGVRMARALARLRERYPNADVGLVEFRDALNRPRLRIDYSRFVDPETGARIVSVNGSSFVWRCRHGVLATRGNNGKARSFSPPTFHACAECAPVFVGTRCGPFEVVEIRQSPEGDRDKDGHRRIVTRCVVCKGRKVWRADVWKRVATSDDPPTCSHAPAI